MYLNHWQYFSILSIIACLVATSVDAQVVNENLKITAADGQSGDQFGHAVAVDQGIIVVGAPYDADNGLESGSAYLFNANTGSQIAKLLPEDGSAGDQFGYSVAIHNGIVVVGAPQNEHNEISSGSAYLFDATTGSELGKLNSNDAAASDEFGYSVDIHNDIVVVGALRNDDLGDSSVLRICLMLFPEIRL